MKPMFSPSLMCMDILRAGEQVAQLNRYADMFHIDIMDGHYCKNITLSPGFANAVSGVSELPLDVHLMVTEPDEIIPLLSLRAQDTISVHAETVNRAAFRILDGIRGRGCRTGIVLNPATGMDAVRYCLDRVDLLTIMTVDVGFAGQSFIPEMLEKIRTAKALREEKGYRYLIQIDGSCNRSTYRRLYEAGADIFVVGGSGLFGLDKDLDQAFAKMRQQFTEETGVML